MHLDAKKIPGSQSIKRDASRAARSGGEGGALAVKMALAMDTVMFNPISETGGERCGERLVSQEKAALSSRVREKHAFGDEMEAVYWPLRS